MFLISVFIIIRNEKEPGCTSVYEQINCGGFLGGSVIKNPSAHTGDVVLILGWEDPLKKEMATQLQ